MMMRHLIPRLAALAAAFAPCAAAFAQTPVVVSTPGATFSPEGRGAGKVDINDVAGGRRFHGTQQRAEVILQAHLRMPPASAAEPKMQRLVIHFATNQSGASLQFVELRNGAKIEFHIDTNLTGDYRTRDTSKPEAFANAWSFAATSVAVSSSSVIRLGVRFTGGIDSIVDPGEFVLFGVAVDFPRKPLLGTSHDRPRASGASSVLGSVPGPGPSPGPPAVPAAGVIYVLANDDQLMWYAHTGREDGTFRWAAPRGKTVGTGWAFEKVFSGGDGVVYAIKPGGDLVWYRHDGNGDGTFRWAAPDGKPIATGWRFDHVFSGGGGSIYAVTSQGDLLWFRHDGRNDGSDRWAAPKAQKVGTGWTFKRVFSGGAGVIYAITATGDLLWFRNDGPEDGSLRWLASEGKKIDEGWNYQHIFSGGAGVIYAITATGDLLWFRHDGRDDGSPRWAAPQGKKVGIGWAVKDIFSGSNGPS